MESAAGGWGGGIVALWLQGGRSTFQLGAQTKSLHSLELDGEVGKSSGYPHFKISQNISIKLDDYAFSLARFY